MAQQTRRVARKSTAGSRFERSEDYRRNFLKHKRGFFGSSLYCCSYCGKLITKSHMQVDHCLPVNSAKNNPFVRGYIRLLGAFMSKSMRQEGINGVWNLVPSCAKCNNKKSDHGGVWVIRGVIGRYLFPVIWYTVFGAAAITFLQFLATGGGPWFYIFKGLKQVADFFMNLSGVAHI